MTNAFESEANTIETERSLGLNRALNSIDNALESAKRSGDQQSTGDIVDFQKMLGGFDTEKARYFGNNVEILDEKWGKTTELHLITENPVEMSGNSVKEAQLVITEPGVSTETFTLSTQGNKLVLERSRVDDKAVEGGTWIRNAELS